MRKLEFPRWEHFPLIAQSRHSSIAKPVVRSNNTSPFNHFLDKAPKAFCRRVRHMFEANPPNSIRRLILDSDDYQSLPFCPSASLTTFTSTNVGFVHLNVPRKSVSSWSKHSPSEFVQPLPGRLVAAWLNDSSKAKSIGTVFLRCDMPYRAKPQPQRLASAMENCPSRYRGLGAAVPAMPQASASSAKLGFLHTLGMQSHPASAAKPDTPGKRLHSRPVPRTQSGSQDNPSCQDTTCCGHWSQPDTPFCFICPISLWLLGFFSIEQRKRRGFNTLKFQKEGKQCIQ